MSKEQATQWGTNIGLLAVGIGMYMLLTPMLKLIGWIGGKMWGVI